MHACIKAADSWETTDVSIRCFLDHLNHYQVTPMSIVSPHQLCRLLWVFPKSAHYNILNVHGQQGPLRNSPGSPTWMPAFAKPMLFPQAQSPHERLQSLLGRVCHSYLATLFNIWKTLFFLNCFCKYVFSRWCIQWGCLPRSPLEMSPDQLTLISKAATFLLAKDQHLMLRLTQAHQVICTFDVFVQLELFILMLN